LQLSIARFVPSSQKLHAAMALSKLDSPFGSLQRCQGVKGRKGKKQICLVPLDLFS